MNESTIKHRRRFTAEQKAEAVELTHLGLCVEPPSLSLPKPVNTPQDERVGPRDHTIHSAAAHVSLKGCIAQVLVAARLPRTAVSYFQCGLIAIWFSDGYYQSGEHLHSSGCQLFENGVFLVIGAPSCL